LSPRCTQLAIVDSASPRAGKLGNWSYGYRLDLFIIE
jgi:hypothetical protein